MGRATDEKHPFLHLCVLLFVIASPTTPTLSPDSPRSFFPWVGIGWPRVESRTATALAPRTAQPTATPAAGNTQATETDREGGRALTIAQTEDCGTVGAGIFPNHVAMFIHRIGLPEIQLLLLMEMSIIVTFP